MIINLNVYEKIISSSAVNWRKDYGESGYSIESKMQTRNLVDRKIRT